MNSGIPRRAFLSVLPLGLAAQVKQTPKKGKPLPVVGEFVRIVDPITENVVVRLTSLNSASVLPYARNQFISARERILLFSSNRGGNFAPFQIDLHTGALRQLAEATRLDPRSVCFDHQEKAVRYLDGNTLYEVGLTRGSPRKLGEGFSAFASTPAGLLYLISGGKVLRSEGNELRSARTLAEGADELWPQPNGAGCLFARASMPNEQELDHVPADTGVSHRCWPPDPSAIRSGMPTEIASCSCAM